MNTVRLSMPVFFIVVSLGYAFLIMRLPTANLGDPYGPFYFPLFICIGLFIFSVVDFIQLKRSEPEENEELQLLLDPKLLKIIGVILALCVMYTAIFEIVGFLIATVLFLGALLFYLNGRTKWVLNLVVTAIFSFSAWYIFTQLLDISLP
ncbi:tripartite tricarboxylate transporter TctB family protein [Alkalicoccobacillus porphyridii]|nr:tripartite tricarboxylate transporter TctB family protein [Alkalicoccobacillus porphyridii]